MYYKCPFFNKIHGISYNALDITLSQDFNIIFSKSNKLLEEFYSPETLKCIGLGDYGVAIQLKTFFFNEFSILQEKFVQEDILNHLLYTCSCYCNSLWLVKDNSVRFNIGHLKYTDGKIITVHSNFINSIYTNCFSEKDITLFSKDEVELAVKYFNFPRLGSWHTKQTIFYINLKYSILCNANSTAEII